tara:strand:+ start:228 stop:428 length:201 start_codon:yes stop_codon:yes gene_type:complete
VNIEAGDMIEVVDAVRGVDALNRLYELFPGDTGLVIFEEGPRSFCGVLIGSEIIYVPYTCMKKAFE